MNAVREALAAGQLQGAIDVAQQQLKKSPADNDLRACLVEMLCLAGQLERADDLLTALARRHPDWIPGAANLRQLLRAQQARLALRAGQLADDVIAQPGPSLDALVAINFHLAQGELEDAQEAAFALERSRVITDPAHENTWGAIRDCDDSLNGYLEGLGTDGRFYLWQWSEIDTLQLHPVTTPIERVWRRAEVGLTDGRQGEVFLPLTYTGNTTDSYKLGRETAWQTHAPALVTGLGLKLFLVGETAMSLEQIAQAKCRQPEVSDAV
ncbi:MAG: virulence protein, SciE type [Alteromonadaceae bacterium]|nr:virulence protein, SciE type [Alteromonadaceae bacterium]|tara:strand:+ start:286 stop:1089 length:804 start_codon:yes stop_codon:yes gene_type:complete